jgi:hypothetical protein
VGTPLSVFEELAEKHTGDGAELYPGLTCRITYVGGVIADTELQCDAMAYYVVKDGMLTGTGAILSEPIKRAWAQTEVIGYKAKGSGVNWPVWIGFILVMLAVPIVLNNMAKMRR